MLLDLVVLALPAFMEWRAAAAHEQTITIIYDRVDLLDPARRDELVGDIRARLVVQMLNEAARALDQVIVRTAAEVDLAMIMGTGFPPCRGGLLRFADSLHPKGVLDRARELEKAHGERFAPGDLLVDLANSDHTFYEAFST